MDHLQIGFDCLASHDLTYVGVIQTAKAAGLDQFPIPYILTNCHNSLCAVGGTLNEDDHRFGLSAAKKYGGIFVPPHLAVIHSYIREMHAACGSMILGSDSHTRYGAVGTMGVGEGGGELVKQLLGKTYDTEYPEIVCVYLRGKVQPGVGPQDVALAIIGAVFKKGYVKNRIMEFTGEGIASLSADFRQGIDVMTTETSCLSSIWQTDDVIKDFLACHGRPESYKPLKPAAVAWYDGLVEVDLSTIEPMIALPFHPSNVYTIKALHENAADILRKTEVEAAELITGKNVSINLVDKVVNGKVKTDQGIIAGCSGGTWENIMAARNIIGKGKLGNDGFALSIYPASQPVMFDLLRNGAWEDLIRMGAIVRTSFCGPCFGAGDVPANGQLSIRHTTRNFPNREGSKPGEGQLAAVALMDARSVAATAINNGILTAATEADGDLSGYKFDSQIYEARVYQGFGKPEKETEIQYGPNITDWPAIGRLEENLLLGIASVINDPVTTTDELIPSGDTSTYRSNPAAMARYTLSRKDPEYVERADSFKELEQQRLNGQELPESISAVMKKIHAASGIDLTTKNTGLGSVIYAVKPGDGSAREQAASCQRVLGGCANIAREYATRRYRSNLINWGLLPLLANDDIDLTAGDFIFIPQIRAAIESGQNTINAFYAGNEIRPVSLSLGDLTGEERRILLAGCLINFYRENADQK
jgi:aconitate hydratase